MMKKIADDAIQPWQGDCNDFDHNECNNCGDEEQNALQPWQGNCMITMIATTTTSTTFLVMTNRLPCNLGEVAPRNNRWRLVVDTNLGFSHQIGLNCQLWWHCCGDDGDIDSINVVDLVHDDNANECDGDTDDHCDGDNCENDDQDYEDANDEEDTLNPVGHQSTNCIDRFVLIVAIAAFTSFGTTSPLKLHH